MMKKVYIQPNLTVLLFANGCILNISDYDVIDVGGFFGSSWEV